MKRYAIPFLLAATLLSCTKEAIDTRETNSIENGPEYITISLEPSGSQNESPNGSQTEGQNGSQAEGPATRTAYTYDGGQLKTSWEAGDVVAIVPNEYAYYNAGLYEVTDPGSSTATFRKVEDVGETASSYAIIYPGDKIKSISQYTKFCYTGQVQKKSDPTAHLGDYHCMFTSVTDYSEISFTGAHQSACMKMNLSGMTFENPVQIKLSILGTGCFYINNCAWESYTYLTSDCPKDPESTSALTLDLEGYGTESSLEAWMMMSNTDVTLAAGDILRVTVGLGDGTKYNSDINIGAATTLSGGHCHRLTVSGGWTLDKGDYTDYSWDGEAVTLQSGKPGLDIVIMGDGFIREDFDDGTYENIMRQTYEEFFSVEPYATLKDDFNVFYVKAPSPERTQATNTGLNGAQNNGHVTKFSATFTPYTTSIKGDDALVREYAAKAFTSNAAERLKDATIIVVVNQECRAGTCWTSWVLNNGKDYGQANAIAYCALGTSADERIQLIHHEAGGHGFGKLADEYYYNTSSLSSSLFSELEGYHELGLYRNADRYIDDYLYSQLSGRYPLTDRTNVQWSALFGTANGYESDSVEALGVYKGGHTYSWGFCRPTENASWSIMNANTGIYNAICRRAIYYRYRRLSGEVTSNIWGTAAELDAFLKWDAEQIMPKLTLPPSGVGRPPIHIASQPEELPFAPPQLISGHWEGTRFIKD